MRYHVGVYSFGSLVNSGLGITKFKKAVLNTLSNDLPDLIYCHDADTLSIGMALKKKHSLPVVFDMHDLHHTWAKMAKPKSLIRNLIANRLESKMLKQARQANLVITSSGQVEQDGHSGFREYLQNHGIESIVVENRPKRDSVLSKKANPKPTIGYLGRVREIEPFKILVKAVQSLDKESRPKIVVRGDGVAFEQVKSLLESSELEVEIAGAFSSEEAPVLLEKIDVMFALYNPSRGNILDGAIPVKMFDAASFGLPSIVNADCLMADICKQESLGQSITWNDSEQLSQAIQDTIGTTVELQTTYEREVERFYAGIKPLL